MKAKQALSVWLKLSRWPGGHWLYSCIICWKAPYFGSIRPLFVELRPGYCEIRLKKRRAVLNHIGTVHAIAMCNLAELAAGTVTEVTLPSTHRWIPRGMSVKYLKKAVSDLRGVAQLESLPLFDAPTSLPVTVCVKDLSDQEVFTAVIDMWVTPKGDAGKKTS